MSELTEWESFYVIVGAAAGALVGLQFVVLTLIAERPPAQLQKAGPVFLTPTIAHFSAVLLLSAILSAPWHGITAVAVLWGSVAIAGASYAWIVMRRMRQQNVYQPDLDDWLFYAALPFVAYAVLGAAALIAPSHPHEALFGVGGVSLLLLFIGIHNAWDSVVYHVVVQRRRTKGNED